MVEIDGSSHNNKQEYDAKRDEFLESLGLTVIHIPVEDVMTRLDEVMEELEEVVPPRQAEDGPPRQPEADTPPVEGNGPPRPLGTPPVEGNFAPIDILDYIYAVLHSPAYREK